MGGTLTSGVGLSALGRQEPVSPPQVADRRKPLSAAFEVWSAQRGINALVMSFKVPSLRVRLAGRDGSWTRGLSRLIVHGHGSLGWSRSPMTGLGL